MFLRFNENTTLNVINCSFVRILGTREYGEGRGNIRITMDHDVFVITKYDFENFIKLNQTLMPLLPQPIRDSLIRAIEEAGFIEVEV